MNWFGPCYEPTFLNLGVAVVKNNEMPIYKMNLSFKISLSPRYDTNLYLM
jgi:hypothetical protein